MTSLLSGVFGKFQLSIVSSTFIPVLIFVLLLWLLVVPLIPGAMESELLAPVRVIDQAWELFLMLFAVVVLGVFMYNINIPLIRIYEGYPWENTWIGRRRKRHYQAELDLLTAQRAGLLSLVAKPGEQERSDHEPDGQENDDSGGKLVELLQSKNAEVRRRIRSQFPKREAILPTRLGNVIRSFEHYPRDQYGMSAIPLYPRLIAKIDAAYATAIEGAKAGLDFMLNSATLSALLAILLLAVGMVYPPSSSIIPLCGRWLLPTLLLSLLSVWFYHQSIEQAGTWGDFVKGSFDLYRNELLKQLGYSQQPQNAQEEREIWGNISKRLIFGDPPQGKGPLISYRPDRPSPTHAHAEAGAVVEVVRGINRAESDGTLAVTLEIRNADKEKRAHNIVVSDTVPEGFAYAWGSAQVEPGCVIVRGTNPYHFAVDTPLEVGRTLRLGYRIIPVVRVN